MMFDLDKINSNIKNNAYDMIGSGSGRDVYDLKNGYVAKVAKNRKGYAQNKAEFHISSLDDSNIFAKIFQESDNHALLIMEMAEKVNDISEVWEYFGVKSNSGLYKKINDISVKYNLILQDFRRPVNWGKIKGRPVIIDYGFTRRVRRKYYSLF